MAASFREVAPPARSTSVGPVRRMGMVGLAACVWVWGWVGGLGACSSEGRAGASAVTTGDAWGETGEELPMCAHAVQVG